MTTRPTKEEVQKAADKLKDLSPPFPATSPFAKKQSKLYSKAKVQDMMLDLLDFISTRDIKMEFEYRLNDKWMNGNNWENEDLYPEFLEDMVNSFID